MSSRERTVLSLSASTYAALALAVALLLPLRRPLDIALVATLVAAYVLVSHVRFEFGNGYVVPEQLVFVPMVLLLPLPLVPALVGLAGLLSALPEIVRSRWHHETLLGSLSDSWFCLGPVVVLYLLAPGLPALEMVEIYALAFSAQIALDVAWSILRGHLTDGLKPRETIDLMIGTIRIDAILSPLALLAALVAVQEPLALLAIAPLIWLLDVFSRDRQARFAATLELQRAYRGTVMLLADVVECEDPYTAEHSRSIVDLADAVAERMDIGAEDRQRLEFAALLHDVGKIAIPKEILHKPAALSDAEYELIKTHTVEGQLMLDRVGGLLGRIGEIVRSCHERWDGAGYPDGLAGEQIPLASRIVFCCDAFNAMTTDRVYRPAMSTNAALTELSANAGTQFDPDVVAVLMQVVEEERPALAPVEEVRALIAGTRAMPRGMSVSA